MAYELRDNTGSAFPNDRKASDKHPDMEGDFKLICPHCQAESRGWLKLWRRQGKTGEWLSAAFKFREKQPTRSTPEQRFNNAVDAVRRAAGDRLDDDIPF